MNNNTQIETAYEAAKRIFQEQNPQDGSCPLWAIKVSKEVANWQKQQDEAYTQHLETTIKLWESKCKEILDSHNELLSRLELINHILLKYADAINGDCCLPNTAFEMITKSNYIKLEVHVNENLINKAKNIKL